MHSSYPLRLVSFHGVRVALRRDEYFFAGSISRHLANASTIGFNGLDARSTTFLHPVPLFPQLQLQLLVLAGR
jgi:hypothetical protein